MRFVRHGLGIIALLGLIGLGTATFAAGDKQSDKGKIDNTTPPAVDIDFGDNSSQYANDGQCDDPRFSGTGSAKRPSEADRGHDMADCQAAIAANTVTFDGGPVISVDFGDDSSSYANNSECDDPRFSGTGMASVLVNGDMLHDATDCTTLYNSGSIALLPVFMPDYPNGAPYDTAGITFGNDASDYANNTDCDDPRFIGPGAAETLLDEDLGRDSTDCTAAFTAGTVVLRADAEANPTADFNVYTSTKDPSIDFGENDGSYINDNECDDPRFEGEGVDSVLENDDQLHDAKDCSELFDAGKITLLAVFGPDYAAGSPYDSSAQDFGNDTSDYANNEECDDPRFIGPGAASILLDDDLMHDGADCKTAFEAGRIVLRAGAEAHPDVDLTVYTSTKDASIDFGDNESEYKSDGQCDDPRFTGEGVAEVLVQDDAMHDSKDCTELFDAGKITIIPVFHPNYVNGAPYSSDGIDFGDDTSSYANNSECDDPRFEGPGVASVVLDEDQSHDAADCKAAVEAGTAALKGATTTTPTTPDTPTVGAIDFGDDTSQYANDTECDDPRFQGEGVDDVLLADDMMHDATDCKALVDSGKLTLIPVYGADYVNGAPYATAGIDFGDNSSDYKDNGECDDPRFVGPGMASTVLDEDSLRDSADCMAKFEAGLVALKGGSTAPTTPTTPTAAAIDFGDDTSEYANDTECDDPRFQGEGVDDVLLSADMMHDATDCKALVDSGKLTLIPVFAADYVNGAPYATTGVDFGDNTSDYKDNGECDDPRFVGPGMAATVLDEDTLHDSADCTAAFTDGKVAMRS